MLFRLWLTTCISGVVFAQSGRISTWAGSTSETTDAKAYPLSNPGQLFVDKDGSVYVSNYRSVAKISPQGQATTVLRANGKWCWGGPYVASRPNRMSPFSNGVTVTEAGELYVSNWGCRMLLRVAGPQVITRVEGSLPEPQFLGVHLHEGDIYATDEATHRVYRFQPSGNRILIAGNGARGNDGDGGLAVEASFNLPRAVVVGKDRSIYIADSQNYRIRRVSPDGVISNFAGTGVAGFAGDGGPAEQARLGNITALALSANGDLLIADNSNRRIRRIGVDGVIRTIAGTGRTEDAGDGGLAAQASFLSPWGVAEGPEGSIYVSDYRGHVVRRISPDGTIMHFAGLRRDSGDGGPAVFARLVAPTKIAFDSAGNGYISEQHSGRVRKVDASGRISTLIDWRFPTANTIGLLPVGDGSVLVSVGATVQRVLPGGRTEVVAGAVSEPGYSGDGGPAIKSRLQIPSGLAAGPDGSIYIADEGQHVVRRVDAEGRIETVAGTGVAGFGGDGGPAKGAQLWTPRGICLDRQGRLYIADAWNNRVRRVDPDGLITTVAGNDEDVRQNGVPGSVSLSPILRIGDPTGNQAFDTPLFSPEDVAVDEHGTLYIADYRAMVFSVSRSGMLRRVGGDWSGYTGPSGDGGDARQALLQARSVALDPNGNLYIVDDYNNVVRKIGGFTPFTSNPSGLVFSTVLGAPAQSQDITIGSSDGEERIFSAQSTASWLLVSPTSGTVGGAQRLTMRVTALPTGRSGYFQGRIVLTDRDTRQTTIIPVSLLVSNTPQQMKLDKTGLTFSAVTQAPTPSPQPISVLNTGIGRMDWTASASTLAGGNWLTLTGTNGSSVAGTTPPQIAVSVNPTGLAPGAYFGLVTATSPQADNAPQSAVVVLEVQPGGAQNAASVSPRGLLFPTDASASQPPANQPVQLRNFSNRAITFAATVAYPENRGSWVQLATANGSLAAGASFDLGIGVRPAGLSPGVYTATVNVRFSPDNVTQSVNVLLVVGSGERSAAGNKEREIAANCTARRLVPLFRTPGTSFTVSVGWPVAIEMIIVDDCGNFINTGRALVASTGGDAAVALTPIGNGRWAGTWTSNAAQPGRLSLQARIESGSPPVSGEARLDGTLRENAQQPTIERSGLRNLANPLPETLVGTGSLVAVLGSRMAAETRRIEQGNWPSELAETRAYIAGRAVPLREVGAGRLEAVVPLGTPENTRHQLVVQRGRSYSPPEEVLVTSAAPVLLSVDGTGRNQGRIFVKEEDGTLRPADSGRPALAGDTVVLLTTGLGETSPAVAAGQLAPADPPSMVVKPLRVTIEGTEAEVLSAVLEPGEVGLYRVTITMPEGLAPSSAANVVIAVDGVESTPVTLAVGEVPAAP